MDFVIQIILRVCVLFSLFYLIRSTVVQVDFAHMMLVRFQGQETSFSLGPQYVG